MQRNHVESGGSLYAVVNGDMHIRNGHPVYRVEPFPLGDRPLPEGVARQQPGRLLTAELRVVGFAGRQEELARLAAWRDAPDPGVSVLLLHGPGGQGKSRLADHFAGLSADLAWTVWAARHVGDPTASASVRLPAAGASVLLVVEYAERWPVDDLLLLLRNPLLRHPERVRVLLIARDAGPWWYSLRHRVEKSGARVGGTLPLAWLTGSLQERQAAFQAARDRFAAADLLDVPGAAGLPAPDWLADDAFGLALTLHMAALVAVDARWRGRAAPEDPVALSAYLLDREHDHWQSLYDHGRISTPPQVMARTVYLGTLSRPLPSFVAADLLSAAGLAEGADAARVLRDHAVCYPPAPGPVRDRRSRRDTFHGFPGHPSGPASTALEPLYPDRLGEDFVALITPGHDLADYRPDEWTATALTRVLARYQEETAPAWVTPALGVLIQAAARWPHLTQRHLGPLLARRPHVALAAEGFALAADPHLDSDVLLAVYDAMPVHGHVGLNIGIAALAQRMTDDSAAEAGFMQRADQCVRLSWHLAECMEFTRAAEAAEEAVRLLHLALAEVDAQVAERSGDGAARYAPPSEAVRQAIEDHDLEALSQALREEPNDDPFLVVTPDRMREMLRERLTTAEGRARVCREAEHDDPVEMTARRAGLLADKAFGLLGSKRVHRVAVESAEQAVALYRELVRTDAETYRLRLAEALALYSTALAGRGRHREALEPAVENLTLSRELAAQDPGRHLPEFANSLLRLSRRLAALGLDGAALTAIGPAVGIGTTLTADDPDTGAPGHASTLSDLAWRHLAIPGGHQEALRHALNSVELHRTPTPSRPDAAGSNPLTALLVLAVALARSGQDTQSLEILGQLVALHRSGSRPEALAEVLTAHGAVLLRAGRAREAAAEAAEAVSLLREVVRPSNGPPVTFVTWEKGRTVRRKWQGDLHDPTSEPDLAAALTLLAAAHWTLDLPVPARAAASEAAEILDRLAGQRLVHEPDLSARWWKFDLVRRMVPDASGTPAKDALDAAWSWRGAFEPREPDVTHSANEEMRAVNAFLYQLTSPRRWSGPAAVPLRGRAALAYLGLGLYNGVYAAYAAASGGRGLALAIALPTLACLLAAVLLRTGSRYADAPVAMVRTCWDLPGLACQLAIVIGTWHGALVHRPGLAMMLLLLITGGAACAGAARRQARAAQLPTVSEHLTV